MAPLRTLPWFLSSTVGLLACNPQSSAQSEAEGGSESESTEAGDGDGEEEGDGDGEPEPALFVAGSRLRPVVLMAESGATELDGWYDSLLEAECEFHLDSGGTLRCLPVNGENPSPLRPYFADPSCTQRVAIGPPASSSVPYAAHQVASLDACAPRLEIRPVLGDWEVGPVYSAPSNVCSQELSASRAPVGEPLDPTMFVAAVDEPTGGDARILGHRRVAEDGSWSAIAAWDTELSVFVEDGRTDDGQYRWVPQDAPKLDSYVYADSSCTEPTAVVSSCPPPIAPYVIGEYTPGCHGKMTLHEGGAQLGEFYYIDEEFFECSLAIGSVEGRYPVGPAVPDTTFLEAELVYMGEGGVQIAAWAASGGPPLRFAYWYDSQHQQRCYPEGDSVGVTRCLPLEETGIRNVYANASCMGEPLATRGSCYETPSPFIRDSLGYNQNLVLELVTPVDPDTPLYELEAGECIPYPVLPGGETQFYETAVADPSQFERIDRKRL